MNSMAIEGSDMDVTTDSWNQLRRFRATHLTSCATVKGIEWEYIACGHGEKALLILPGLLGIGEMLRLLGIFC